MKKDKRKIPKGYYCYKQLKDLKNGSYKVVGVCPYWSERKDKREHENGYCKFLEKGDWDINKEREYKDVNTGKRVRGCFSLIWDMVKECGIKMMREIK